MQGIPYYRGIPYYNRKRLWELTESLSRGFNIPDFTFYTPYYSNVSLGELYDSATMGYLITIPFVIFLTEKGLDDPRLYLVIARENTKFFEFFKYGYLD